jgi:hypothetical protein
MHEIKSALTFATPYEAKGSKINHVTCLKRFINMVHEGYLH